MRHKVSGKRLSRGKDERRALRRIMVNQLFTHERIKTTRAKAQAIRGQAERLITLAKRGNSAGDAQMVHARRLAAARMDDPEMVKKLFDDMAISIAKQKEIEEDYGLTIQDLTPSLAKYMSYESDQGALVSNIRKGSRADQDGIETGDIFVEIDGKRIKDVISLKDALTKSKSSVKVKIFRKSRYLSITIHPK